MFYHIFAETPVTNVVFFFQSAKRQIKKNIYFGNCLEKNCNNKKILEGKKYFK